jgi:adenine-specific DNA-methyltransferase
LDILEKAELIRVKKSLNLDPKKKNELGQFYTPKEISLFMGTLFKNIEGDIKLLDPGCGTGILFGGFIKEAIRRGNIKSIELSAFEIDESIENSIEKTLKLCKELCHLKKVKLKEEISFEDFIGFYKKEVGLWGSKKKYTHVILNPPYKKISSQSKYRKDLRFLGIETVNLYAGFVSVCIQNLEFGGELVAIIPRSFCNGPYYKGFREQILREAAIEQIHIFDSRKSAFSGDKVLQENVIIHLIKGRTQGNVKITSSPCADFHWDKESESVTATDKTIRDVPFCEVVNPNDKEKFIHITANKREQDIVRKISVFNKTLEELGLEVSTGPVVDFRMKEFLRLEPQKTAAPLIYPIHLKKEVKWPLKGKKANCIEINKKTQKWLWKNKQHYIIVRRFSSKEEKRRIVATFYNKKLPGELIGFENKVNVFHRNKIGLEKELALGLFVYLNSTLLDKYYRIFGGHTQVNATDLRNIHYPCLEVLKRIGKQVAEIDLEQKEIDKIIEKEINKMTGKDEKIFADQEKIDEAISIIRALGMPKQQQNERSGLTLLAILNLKPEDEWEQIEKPLIGVTPIMDWCREYYGKEYAPNTRETFRRQTLHQFVDGGLCLYNPDKPGRPVNSPKACYQIAPELYEVLKFFKKEKWEEKLQEWLENRRTLAEKYAKAREMKKIPLKLDDGTEVFLSPGAHSQLIKDIIVEFGPRFVPGAEVVYIGDTGAKEDFFDKEKLKKLGVQINRKGKLPDVVLFCPKNNWLLLIESVTSHGPVDGKRHGELEKLFKKSKAGLVYVTAFPDRKIMGKYLGEISWETEVWVAEAPTHMIHFNGDKFLGPHKK